MTEKGFPGSSVVKNPPANAGDTETGIWSLDQEDLLEEEMETTLVFLSGESHGQKYLAGYSPWVAKESDTTEHTHLVVISLF